MVEIALGTATQWINWISAVLLLIAALLALIRLTVGPTTLDRAVAIDLLTAVAIGVTALVIVWWVRADLLVLMIIFALTGFFSSVAIAKYSGRSNNAERKLLSKEESKMREAELQRLEETEEYLEQAGIDAAAVVALPEQREEDAL